MSQWKNDDSAANSVLWGVVIYGKTGNVANRDAFAGNSTPDAYKTGLTVGQYGVDNTEMAVNTGGLISGKIIDNGTGYTANATVTFTVTNGGSSAVANAQANSVGKISTINVTTRGSGYITAPTLAISAPANTTFNGNTAVTGGAGGGANSVITLASAGSFVAGDAVLYQVATGNTAVGGLTNNTTYFIEFANSTVVSLAAGVGGARITLTKSFTEAGHALQGRTATAVVYTGGGRNSGAAHAGWVVRKEGSGGRAGRVQYETLVAMGSMNGDASDDFVFPDS
jgi:hypothetical protein